MIASAIIEQLHDLGVSVRLNGSKVRMEPGSKVPPGLLAEVRQHKTEIVQELNQSYGDGQAPPLDRPPETEQELRRWMDYTADPKRFAERLEQGGVSREVVQFFGVGR